MIEKTIFIVKPIYVPVKVPIVEKPVSKKALQEQIYLQMLAGPKYLKKSPRGPKKAKKIKKVKLESETMNSGSTTPLS